MLRYDDGSDALLTPGKKRTFVDPRTLIGISFNVKFKINKKKPLITLVIFFSGEEIHFHIFFFEIISSLIYFAIIT